MKNTNSIQLKIAIVYIILFGAALFSVSYIYKEVKRITPPEQSIIEESNKIFLISSTITNLYSTEASSRNAILTGKNSDIKKYNSQINSINQQIDSIKNIVDDSYIIKKLDTVQQLLDKKKKSFQEIIRFRKSIKTSENYDFAISEIYNIKDEIQKKHLPPIETSEKQRKSFWSRLAQAFHSEVSDTNNTIVNYPRLTDSLVNAIEKIFSEVQEKDNLLQKQLIQKEQILLFENKNLTTQLQNILESVEQNILNNSYQKINLSKIKINEATKNIAWIGGSAIVIVLILGWIILRDLNQTQKYRLELETLNKEKEDLLRSKSMLLATVTHDIQTPLNSVLGFTDLLEQTPLAMKQNRYVKNIQSSSEYIVKLVNDLIDFSKLENNKINITNEAFNFQELINSTCSSLVPNANNKNIEFKWTIEPILNSYYISDPERIKQILTNLITNAIKFTQKGGVYVDAKAKEDKIRIEISDSGIGIEKDQIDNIFDEFRQAHSGIEKKFGGTGLGLNISKRIIKLLHGSINVESELGHGSVFIIELPLVKAGEGDLKKVRNKKYFNTSNNEILKLNNILVIDDDKLQLQLMEEVFTPIFNKVFILNDASTIIDFLEKEKIDLILTDIQMPKVDGFELIETIKKHEHFKNIPAIALSGKRDLTDKDFIEHGFVFSHPKPVKVHLLIKEIIKILHPDFTEEALNIKVNLDSKTEKNSNNLYNISELQQFIGTNPEDLKNILSLFIEETNKNILDLKFAAENFDIEATGNIAHKMLPMFRQIKVNTVIPFLEPLEDQSKKFKNKEDIVNYIDKIAINIESVLEQIKNIELD